MKQIISRLHQRFPASLLSSLSRRAIVGCAIGGFLLALFIVFLLKTALALHLSYSTANHAVNKPLTITLNQSIRDLDLSRITITPNVGGAWQLKRGNFLNTDQLIFTPSTYFTVNTRYVVALPLIERYVAGDRSAPFVIFSTESAPSLLPKGVAALTDNATIAADYEFSAHFSSPNHSLRKLVLRTTPAIEMTASHDNDTIFKWKPTNLLPQGSELGVELYDEKNAKSLLQKTIRVAPEPQLVSPRSRDHVGERDSIVLVFDQPINPDSSRLLSFSTPGNGSWQSPTEYTFTPTAVSPGQAYSYKISPGLRSTAGGILASEQTGTFATTGRVSVSGAAPHGRELAQHRQVVSFTFDQPVDHASAERRFSISSGTIEGFSWQGNTLQATVTNLGYQQTITAKVDAGVTNAGFGLPSNEMFIHTFTTEIRSTRLSVPAYRQQHSGTCTAASLRMALSYRGIGSDEIGLVNAMGYAPRDKDTSTNPPTWDDPMQMFVGSIDGSIIAGTGAGPDAPPVAKAARAYGRSAQNVTGINAGWIADQIYAGHPVLMFGSFRSTGTTTWRTPSGGNAIMNLTGHVTVVTGVKGEPSAPLGFWVNDPLVGSTQYWSAGSVSANISRDPYRQAVVVY